jgi:iron-sulfur cluster repair protein YtfE (RIC family)
MAARHGRRWVLASLTGAAVAAVGAIRLRARRTSGDPAAPAEVSFMRAMHAALRRDLSRLQEAATRLDSAAAPPTVLAGWDDFRTQLEHHHAAEDDDLWPVLRSELSDPDDLAAVDAMVAEHQHIPPALAEVDAALRDGGGDLPAAAQALSTAVLDHLEHEETAVLPLIEKHMTRAQWRAFLVKERNRQAPRARAEFLAWLLADADSGDADAVFAEMPRPVPVVYRRILKPRYDAQRRWQI